MKELFQLSFRCTKLKCGVIWAFVVMSAPGPRREHHLGSATCHVPCEKPSRGGRQAAGSVRGCSFLSCRGRFVQLGRCSRRGLGDFTQNINTNWKTCEIQVERFWECSTSVFILLLYICFVFIRNPASTLFFINTKQMYFFVEIKMLWHCILQL